MFVKIIEYDDGNDANITVGTNDDDEQRASSGQPMFEAQLLPLERYTDEQVAMLPTDQRNQYTIKLERMMAQIHSVLTSGEALLSRIRNPPSSSTPVLRRRVHVNPIQPRIGVSK